MIELRDLTKTFGPVTALRGVSLTVRAGSIFGVIGQSGAGKSTLIRCVNLLERPSQGRVVVDGRDLLGLSERELRVARRGIGMIFQHFNLFSAQTVASNIAYPLEIAGWKRSDIDARIHELLELVGLAEKASAYPAQLSGGQKQRVGIARALAPRPSVLLSDEATSALDPETTRSVLGLLRDINRKLGLTVLLITHQLEVVKAICDEVAILERGALVEAGRVVELMSRPDTRLHALCYPPLAGRDWPHRAGAKRVAITFVGERSTEPVVTTMARRFGIDANLLEGSLERIGDARVGRLVLEITGNPEALAASLAFLREQGLSLEELG